MGLDSGGLSPRTFRTQAQIQIKGVTSAGGPARASVAWCRVAATLVA